MKEKASCFHCGQRCEGELLVYDEKKFCCLGCKTVYEILSTNDLCEYYDLDANPGLRQKDFDPSAYEFLNEPSIRKKMLEFDSTAFSRVQFFIPSVHCISCVWLLENLTKINRGVLRSELNFPKKTVTIDFDPESISLAELAALLASLGYAPRINLESEAKPISSSVDNTLLIKLAVAGFCFGNVMLLSFPEYLGISEADKQLVSLFSWLNVILSIPVLLYSGSDYLHSAWSSFKYKHLSIDVPIAVGLIALFARSLFDIATQSGAGYLDSFTGLVFFLLIGRWFQGKTYEALAFDRDYKSYFPLAIQRLQDSEWKPSVIYDLVEGDTIRVRNMEIVPADSELVGDEAFIDYSFVTGEARPVHVQTGDTVYAGGRLAGQPVELKVLKKTSQSQLTKLWNHDVFRKPDETRAQLLLDKAARWFTWAVLGIATATGLFWYFTDTTQVWLILTAVLMVACPCALALTAPFTYGSMLRFFGRNGLYLKNAAVIERMARIDTVVFDKTGTITKDKTQGIEFVGDLTDRELEYVKLLTGFSTHPLSRSINRLISGNPEMEVREFGEIAGKGVHGVIEGNEILVGSCDYTGGSKEEISESSRVYVSVNSIQRGYFLFTSALRDGVVPMLKKLANSRYGLTLLSGDNDSESDAMRKLFGAHADIQFNKVPEGKLHYIQNLRDQSRKVMMLGDGLNDAGALKQSDVGLAVSDDTGVFSPACDGILQGDQVKGLPTFLKLSRAATYIVRAGFVISFVYNSVALAVAVTGLLTPLTAAVLMPLSSISVVLFSTLAVNVVGNKLMKRPEIQEEKPEEIEIQLQQIYS